MTKHEEAINYYRDKLEQEALNYARMKATGGYVENGIMTVVHASSQKEYTEMFAGNMKRCADDLLRELTRTPLPERNT